MLIILSPAKTLNMEARAPSDFYSIPNFLDKSQRIVDVLQKKNIKQLEKLMGISTQLAQLNFERYQQWHQPYTPEQAKQAIFAFRGDVYTGIDVDSLTSEQLKYAQDHLRILSGLYGILKPMDSILPYRLEMGTNIAVQRKKNLYDFWGDIITNEIKGALDENNILINLASNEYFKSINKKKLNATIITPVFKDFKNGKYKMVSFFAKKARGMMSRFILQNKLNKVEDLKHFEEDGYFFNEKLSTETSPTFTRG
jgi:cytoplasmic iron level regulating protein YaaA (DUF328/UPF0246 family)